MYSKSCCSRSFEAEIMKISQSSHNMYSNNILNFQESTTILNSCTIKVWKPIVYISYVCLVYVCMYVCIVCVCSLCVYMYVCVYIKSTCEMNSFIYWYFTYIFASLNLSAFLLKGLVTRYVAKISTSCNIIPIYLTCYPFPRGVFVLRFGHQRHFGWHI